MVQNSGGTSVCYVYRDVQFSDQLLLFRDAGDDLVVVLSAMSGETNRLIDLAKQISGDTQPVPRELDVIVSTGEQVTIALLAMALIKRGVPAVSYTGNQVRILTDSAHNKARILQIDDQKIRGDLKAGRVVVVAGFQGVDEHGNITTLGRGGSDTTGVAFKILGPISAANIEVDMIVQNVAHDNTTDFTFTVHRNDYQAAQTVLENTAREIGAREVVGDTKIAKVSIVGVGMRSHAGVASRMFESLAKESINIQMISTSEIKVSVVIEEKYLELAVRALHTAFELDAPARQGE
ncbi:aspartate kinase [Pseudomonas sp. NPDC087598]|uniref:aspartate kinase n=1 Tax=Pseudomonas sp. NPDC087598 TaxID=3364440 RepID=UPI0038304F52